jgi:hypothetical protein
VERLFADGAVQRLGDHPDRDGVSRLFPAHHRECCCGKFWRARLRRRLSESSQEAAKAVHLADLAVYLDKQRAQALKKCRLLSGGK